MESMTFARWLKRLRAEQDLTQESLAELVGCATPTLRSFEINKRRPSREMAERIANVLKVPLDQRTEFLRLARLSVDSGDTATSDEVDPNVASHVEKAQPNPLPPAHPTLPPLPGRLIGREAEQNALQQLLLEEQYRLITLVGTGGIGKTRLALELAHQLAHKRLHGAVFVALAPLQSTQHLLAALATATGIHPQAHSRLMMRC